MTDSENNFGFAMTASDVIAGVDLSGKRAIVTGGASGIGVETARALASAGAEVTLAVRNLAAGEQARAAIERSTANGPVRVLGLDLADLRSVATFATGWAGPLDILVANAGVMATPEARTKAGTELQFATNYLGHFALARALHPVLAAAEAARLVVVSSTAHLSSPVVFGDIDFRFRPYDPGAAYAQSKTADVLLAVGAAERWAQDGIVANALNPGAILTNLQRHTGGQLRSPEDMHKTPEQGAATSVLLAASPVVAGVTGAYFDNCQEAIVVDARPTTFRELAGVVARYALDRDAADRLWEYGHKLIVTAGLSI
jgi:NAD(P)-dependent dehydrogenase (short-subunit alcohol dehydrogenase family)